MTVSIIVPVYNIQDYLEECIQSILHQTYRNIEIILVDDGSTDRSGEICDRYARQDSRIVVIHKENGGLVSARKAGIVRASGEYVLYVDGDDWIDIDCIENYVKAAKTHADAVICFGVYKNYEDGREIKVRSSLKEETVRREEFEEKIFPHYIRTDEFYATDIPMTLWVYFVKREILCEAVLRVDERVTLGEDFISTFLILLQIESVYLLDNCFYHYRQRKNSMVHTLTSGDFLNLKVLYRQLRKIIKKNKQYKKEQLLKKLCYFIYFAMMEIKTSMKLLIEKNGLFFYSKLEKNTNIVIYGAGVIGSSLKSALEDSKEYRVAAWSDKGWKNYKEHGKNLIAPEKINEYEYDAVCIAVSRSSMAQEIKAELLELGIPDEKIMRIDAEEFTEENLPF